LVLGCLPSPALGQGEQTAAPDFTWSPAVPLVGQSATFTPSGVPDAATVTWDYENGGTGPFTSDTSHAFASFGAHTVIMRVTTGNNANDYPKVVQVNARPVASFEYSPTNPDPKESVLFVSTSTDPDDSIASVAWDFDADGKADSTKPTETHSFLTAGPHNVTVTVTDQDGATDSKTTTVNVHDPSAPTASFDLSPSLPLTGQDVTFTSSSTASSGTLTEQTWDLDGNGTFGDASGASATKSYTTPGDHFVQLRVKQTNGATAIAGMTFRVNAPPVPGFVWSPSSPVAGQQVELISTSVDAEGPLKSQDWDLDGDGQFDDASGPSATHTFDAGDHVVGLRTTDSDGVVRQLTRTLTVGAPLPVSPVDPVVPVAPPEPTTPIQPAAAPPPPTQAPPGRLSAVVRLNGIVLNRVTRIKVLSVRAPLGANVTARCTGKGCPRRSQRQTSVTGRLRFSTFERRLRAGVQLEVFVQAKDLIGKYTRFLLRAGKSPIRTERCLMPGSSEPVRCPL
jgi:PKD repeat protein